MPGENEAADAEYAEFANASTVEVGDPEPDAKPAEEPKPTGKRGPKEPAKAPVAPIEASTDGVEIEEGDEGEGEEDEEEEQKPKKTQTPSERIRELNKRLRTSERLRLADTDRLSALEATIKNGGLPNGNAGGNSSPIGTAPDPQDSSKYPLGHLDDRYIEDKLEWLATDKAAKQADAVLQRQQENEQNAALNQQREDLLGKVDDLAARGAEVSDDFQEAVVEAGMRGDWKLSQPTFEAAHEAEHGAQILYDLSQDKKEAERVAKLTPYQQTKFVIEKNTELLAKSAPRRIPGAGAPPMTQSKGANSRVHIRPDTDNLDDFEKAWDRDAKRK